MRVLLLTGFIPSCGGGGVERHVYDLALGLIQRGIDVTIACENNSLSPAVSGLLKDRLVLKDPQYNSRVTRCLLKGPENKNKLVRSGRNMLRIVWRSGSISSAVKAGDYDVIHSHAYFGTSALVKNKLKLRKKNRTVTTFHGTGMGFFRRMQQFNMGSVIPLPDMSTSIFMEYLSARSSDICIGVSHNVSREVARYYGVSQGKIRTVYNWSDNNMFYPRGKAESRKKLGLSSDKKYIFYAGRPDVMKGYGVLLDAMKSIPDVTLLMATNNNSPIPERLTDNVVRLGFVDNLMPDYYSACDIFAFPSLYEGLPLVMIEAISCGCVPICMNIPPMNEIVDHSSGYFCDLFKPGALATTLDNALSAGELPSKSAMCIKRSRDFGMNKSIDQTLEIYESLIKK